MFCEEAGTHQAWGPCACLRSVRKQGQHRLELLMVAVNGLAPAGLKQGRLDMGLKRG